MNALTLVGLTIFILGIFSGKGHLVKLKKDFKSSILKDTYLDEKAIMKIEVLEVVKLQFDNYNLDIQRLASRENVYIDFFQAKTNAYYKDQKEAI